jgi:chorismate mutase/prephenate dehydrogenase
MPLGEHDRLMGYVLGLSHLTNLVFAEVLAQSGIPFESLSNVASTTFNAQLEVTRPVTRENQDLYYEIQVGNAFSSELLGHMEAALINYGDAIRGEDRKRFRELMEAGRSYLEGERDALFSVASEQLTEEASEQPVASAPFDDLNFDP